MNKNTLKAYTIIYNEYINNKNIDTNEKSQNTYWQAMQANLSINDLIKACKYFKSPKQNKKIIFEYGIIYCFMLQIDYNKITNKQVIDALMHYDIDISSLIYYAKNDLIKKIYYNTI